MTLDLPHLVVTLEIAHLLISVGLAVRVIMRRPNTGVALAWLFIVAMVPFVGAAIYLLLGERRISAKRVRRIAARRADYRQLMQE